MSLPYIRRRALAAPFASTIAREVDQLQNNIRRMFENPVAAMADPLPFPQPIGWMPPAEVSETDAEIRMTLELPGLDQGDVHVELDGDLLTIRGEKREERVEEGKEKQFHLEERSYGAFQRSFTLPPTVDVDKIAASFAKGVLMVTLPKGKVEKPQGRAIPIEAR